MKKSIYKTVITSNGHYNPKKWLKTLCEFLLSLANKENEILYLLKQEPRTIEEIVLGHFVLKHPEIEDYASDILEYLMDNLRYEECFTYEEDTLLLTITLEEKFFELCKELGIKTA